MLHSAAGCGRQATLEQQRFVSSSESKSWQCVDYRGGQTIASARSSRATSATAGRACSSLGGSPRPGQRRHA